MKYTINDIDEKKSKSLLHLMKTFGGSTVEVCDRGNQYSTYKQYDDESYIYNANFLFESNPRYNLENGKRYNIVGFSFKAGTCTPLVLLGVSGYIIPISMVGLKDQSISDADFGLSSHITR